MRISTATNAATLLLAALSVTLPASSQVPDGAVHFDHSTDTIRVAGHTELGTAATFEARVLFPSGGGASGMLFNEYTFAAEDKQFSVSRTVLRGYAFPVATELAQSTTIVEDVWHHIAFVHDSASSQQRLYLDGAKIATQAANADIADSGTGGPFIGALMRDALFTFPFQGYLDTIRISDVARYTGDSFTPPPGDLADDANTIILYNFNAWDYSFDQGMILVADLSGNEHTGTLGTGFPNATAPTTHAILDIDGDGLTSALTDGLLVLRRQFGFTGATLTNSAVGGDCTRCDAAAIEPHIAALGATLDIDDNAALGALTDGLLVIRFLFGFTGTTLTSNAVGGSCDRCDAAAIEPYLHLLD